MKFFLFSGQGLLVTLSQAVSLAALRQPLSAKRQVFYPGYILVSLLVSRIFFLRTVIVIGVLAVKLHLGQVPSTFRLLGYFLVERKNVIGESCSSIEKFCKQIITFTFSIFSNICL